MDDWNALLAQAERLQHRQQFADAEALLRRAAALSPTVETQLALGVFLAEREAYGEALRTLTAALDLAAGDIAAQQVIFSNLAAIYRVLGDEDLARRFQRRALALCDAADAHDLLAWSADALLAGKTSLAEQLARQALELSDALETQADAWGILGVVAARQGRPRTAIRRLIRAARGHSCTGDQRGLGGDYRNLAEVCGLIERFPWQRAFLVAAESCFRDEAMAQSVDGVQTLQREGERLALYRGMVAQRN